MALLLQSSSIFSNSCLNDNIRQTYLDLKARISEVVNDEEKDAYIELTRTNITEFLKESQEYLEKYLSVGTAEELFATISLCYSSFQEYSLPLISDFIQKSRSNSNYIIVFASILGELKKSQPELFNQDYHAFINDCLKEILPQIQKSSTSWTIFNHQIAHQFCNDLIINLLIAADLTKELFLDFFPSILSHKIYSPDPKYDSLLQIFIKNNFAKILPLKEISKSEILEFLTTNNIESISKMSQEAFLLIFGAIVYSETEGETVIDGLDEDSILPFLVLLTFIDSKNESITLINQNELLDMLYEKVHKLKFNENPLFDKSLKIIIDRRLSFSVAFGDGDENDYLKEIEIFLLQKAITENEFFIEKDEFLKWFFSTNIVDIRRYDGKIDVNDFTLFLLSNRNEISKNLFPANNHKLFDACFSQECILQFIENNLETPDIIAQFFYFLRNYTWMFYCSDSVRNQYKSIYYQKLKEKNWKDFILIGLFLNCDHYKNDFYDDKIPDHIQYLLHFKEDLDENDLDIDKIIEMIILEPNLMYQYGPKLFDLLFKAILKDKEIRQIYFDYLVCNNIQNGQKVEELIQLLSNYKDYQYDLTDAIVRNFYYDEEKNILIKRFDVILSSFPIPKFGQSIVEKFYSLIEKNQETFQSFLCLKCIARSFPFLFKNDDKRIFNMVLPFLDNISYIYNDKKIEKLELVIYATFSAISFLFSALQAPFMLDKFVVFVIENIKSFTDWQVVCFISIFCVLINDQSLYLSFIPILLKYNFIEIIINLLEKDFQNKLLLIEYRTNIYYFLALFFISLSNICEGEKMYEVIMINEIMKVENPFNYVFDYLFSTSPRFVNMNNDKNNSIYQRLLCNDDNYKHLVDSFMTIDVLIGFPLMNNNSDFYDEDSKEFITFKNNLIEIMKKTKIIDYSLPFELSKITIKMVRYLSTKKSFIFLNYLNSEKSELNQFLYDELLKAGQDLKKMENESIEHPEEKDNRDIESIDFDEFLIDCDIKQLILKILVNQLMQKKSYDFLNYIYTAIWSICMNKSGKKVFPFLFDTICQFLNEDCYDNINILRTIRLLEVLIKIEEFKSVFIDSKCCEKLINIVLLPKTRIYDKILIETAKLFDRYETNLPIRISQLISFLFQSKEKQNIISLIFSLISKFDQKQIENIDYIIMNDFEKEISKGEINDTIIQYYKSYKGISEGRKYDLILLLKKAFENIGNDYQLLKNIGILLTILAPTKGTLSNNSSQKNDYSYKSSIPSYIRETSPEFWDLFDKHKEIILSSIDQDPLLLNQFSFLLDYPELISIQTRITFFINNIRNNVKGNLTLRIDRENILESSFDQLKDIPSDRLLNNIQIEFIDEIVEDFGGARREWFTLLTKEIFNQKNCLFKCYDNNSYQPNPRSSIQPNHLEYFYFAGRIIARLIVDAQCIESHLTRSFYRFILYGKTKFEDLEEIDSNLYSSLKWMINNDVSQLCKIFAIDVDEFDTHKVVELKENGEKIEVNNENKKEYVELHSKYILLDQIHQQLDAFKDGFNSIIDSESIAIFNTNELDLVLCGIPIIDVEDFKANTTFGDPYTADSPVIKMFFNVISKWKNEDLAKLLMFMTGSSRVPANGFKEFCEMTCPLKIEYGGDRSLWPQSHTCFNILHLPQYESEEEMNEKLLYAIQYCNSFGLH